jgi:hypothetical protein
VKNLPVDSITSNSQNVIFFAILMLENILCYQNEEAGKITANMRGLTITTQESASTQPIH